MQMNMVCKDNKCQIDEEKKDPVDAALEETKRMKDMILISLDQSQGYDYNQQYLADIPCFKWFKINNITL